MLLLLISFSCSKYWFGILAFTFRFTEFHVYKVKEEAAFDIYIHTYIHKLYLSSDFSVAYKLVSPIPITNFKSYSKNKAKKRKKNS